MGAVLAFAARYAAEDGAVIWRHPAHLSAWILGFVVFAPMSAYLLLRYPDWSLMYVTAGQELSTAAQIALALTCGLSVVVGALLGLWLTRRGSATGALSVAALTGALGAGLLVWGADRVWRVGSYATFHDGARKFMTTLPESRLGLALLFLLPALAGAWIYAVFSLQKQGTSRDF